jgi:hypothetical protein
MVKNHIVDLQNEGMSLREIATAAGLPLELIEMCLDGRLLFWPPGMAQSVLSVRGSS